MSGSGAVTSLVPVRAAAGAQQRESGVVAAQGLCFVWVWRGSVCVVQWCCGAPGPMGLAGSGRGICPAVEQRRGGEVSG